MRIKTGGHGSFPRPEDLRSDIPHIAFVNSDAEGTFLVPVLANENLLIIGADDLDKPVIPSWIRTLLVKPEKFSFPVKKYAHKRSRVHGQPCAPMAIGDARKILEFVLAHREKGAEQLLITCEYGKSRSVTVARFLELRLFGKEDQQQEPNEWVHELMVLGHNALYGLHRDSKNP